MRDLPINVLCILFGIWYVIKSRFAKTSNSVSRGDNKKRDIAGKDVDINEEDLTTQWS